jgi:hypothetical protein
MEVRFETMQDRAAIVARPVFATRMHELARSAIQAEVFSAHAANRSRKGLCCLLCRMIWPPLFALQSTMRHRDHNIRTKIAQPTPTGKSGKDPSSPPVCGVIDEEIR